MDVSASLLILQVKEQMTLRLLFFIFYTIQHILLLFRSYLDKILWFPHFV